MESARIKIIQGAQADFPIVNSFFVQVFLYTIFNFFCSSSNFKPIRAHQKNPSQFYADWFIGFYFPKLAFSKSRFLINNFCAVIFNMNNCNRQEKIIIRGSDFFYTYVLKTKKLLSGVAHTLQRIHSYSVHTPQLFKVLKFFNSCQGEQEFFLYFIVEKGYLFLNLEGEHSYFLCILF